MIMISETFALICFILSSRPTSRDPEDTGFRVKPGMTLRYAKHMNDNENLETLEDPRVLRRERKKRPRMRQHGRALKKLTERTIKHITKIERDPRSFPLSAIGGSASRRKVKGRRRGL